MMGREVEVEANTTLGRAAGNGIVLADPSVSSRHAGIFFRDGVAWIEDAASTNGISVNGRETRAAELRQGDRVELGEVRLVVVSDNAPLVAERTATPAGGGRRVFHWPRRGVLARRIVAAALVLATLDYLTNVTGCRGQPGMVLSATLQATAQGFKRDGVKLTVRETAGLERIAEPVTRGLPFPIFGSIVRRPLPVR
jgi:pSer/pThr/pTyr-binding forkhead associated (FHA) protein